MRGGVFVAVGQRRQSPVERWITFAIRCLITAFAVWVAAQLVGGFHLEGLATTLAVALVLGFLNAYLKPILVFGTFPLLVMTVGLFLVLINTLLLAFTAWLIGNFTDNIRIDGFWSALWSAVIISLVSFAVTRVINPQRVASGVTRDRRSR